MDLAPVLKIIGELEGDRFASRIDVEAAWERADVAALEGKHAATSISHLYSKDIPSLIYGFPFRLTLPSFGYLPTR